MPSLLIKSLLLISATAILAIVTDANATIVMAASYWLAIVSGIFFAIVWQHKIGPQENGPINGRLVSIDDSRNPVLLTDPDGTILAANAGIKKLFKTYSDQTTSVEQLFSEIHEKADNREQADQTLQAILQAPGLRYEDTINTKSGGKYHRITYPVREGTARLWEIEDLTSQNQSEEDKAFDQAVLETHAAETVEIAEQLYLAKGELEKQRDQLNYLANTDTLTDMNNRRNFMKLSNDLAVQSGEELFILMLDIDHFKMVNDTHGHAAGDQVIQAFAQTIKENIGSTHIPGRLGGEEFAVLLPDSTEAEATETAEKIRAAVEAAVITAEGAEIRHTVSIGIANHDENENIIEQTLDRADKALYFAKESGRNRVHVFDKLTA